VYTTLKEKIGTITLNNTTEAYLDIETTGLSFEFCDITVVGINIVNGHEAQLTQIIGTDITPESIFQTLNGVEVIYTYNGSRFDLPFINYRLGANLTDIFEHQDLMYSCWKNNLYGGLKSVERQLGIPRNLKDVNGFEAIRLWWRYINDYDENALSTLLEYNKEDVINLVVLKQKLLQTY